MLYSRRDDSHRVPHVADRSIGAAPAELRAIQANRAGDSKVSQAASRHGDQGSEGSVRVLLLAQGAQPAASGLEDLDGLEAEHGRCDLSRLRSLRFEHCGRERDAAQRRDDVLGSSQAWLKRRAALSAGGLASAAK